MKKRKTTIKTTWVAESKQEKNNKIKIITLNKELTQAKQDLTKMINCATKLTAEVENLTCAHWALKIKIANAIKIIDKELEDVAPVIGSRLRSALN